MDAEILTMAGKISGAGETEQPMLELFCSLAYKRWEQRLRWDVTEEMYGDALICAAALDAAADLMDSRAGGSGFASFTLGDLGFQSASAAECLANSATLRRAAERMMASYAEDDTFIFKGVRG